MTIWADESDDRLRIGSRLAPPLDLSHGCVQIGLVGLDLTGGVLRAEGLLTPALTGELTEASERVTSARSLHNGGLMALNPRLRRRSPARWEGLPAPSSRGASRSD